MTHGRAGVARSLACWTSITIGLASSGCSGGESEPPATVTSEPAPPTVAPTPPTPTSEAPPAAPTPPPTTSPPPLFPAFEEPAPGEPDLRPELERLEVTERTIRDDAWIVPRIAHPEASVRDALDREILATLDGLGRVDANGGECWAPLAHPRLVTFVCYGYREGNRGGEDPVVETRHYAIEGSELRAVDPDEAFVEGAPIAARLAAIVDPDGGGDHCCRGWLLGPYGVLLWAYMGPPEAEIPYDALREYVRPDGPLAPMLASLATPPVPAAPSDPSANAPPPPSTPTLHGWAFGPERSPAETLAAWRELSDEERAYVSIHVGREERTRLLVTSDRRWRDAYRLDEQRWRSGDDWRAPSRLVRGANDRVAPARASTELVLREGPSPSSAVVSAIPRGTDLFVVIGSVGRHASSLEHGWAFVAADAERAGWVSARSVAASPRCHDVEAPRPQLRGLAGAHHGPRGLAPVIGRAGLELLFTTTVSESRSGFDVLTIDEACGRGPSVASGTIEGELEDLRVIGFGAEQGPLAVIVAAASTRPEAPEGTVRWSLFGPGASTAGWTADLPGDASLDESARVRVTVSAEQHLAIRWPDGREGHVRWDMAAIAFVEEPAGIGLPAPASTPTE